MISRLLSINIVFFGYLDILEEATICLISYPKYTMKLIVVTGWVMSGLGKWITASSIWRLMKSCGYSVTMMKLDPYINIDAGTMSPLEHGETFVTKDGFETDLDLWHYERFIDEELTRESSVTTAQIYLSVIQKERRWEYLWRNVQVIPNVTDEVKNRIKKVSEWKDITIVEIGGTVWDIEWPHFIESVRQLRREYGRENVLFVHVVPILTVSTSGEMKSKALQHSVIQLRQQWIHASILVCRTTKPMTQDIKKKIALYCDLDQDRIIEARDQKSIYSVPLAFQEQNLHNIISERFFCKSVEPDMTDWRDVVDSLLNPQKTISIAMMWKYTTLDDSYISVFESLKHAWAQFNTKVEVVLENTENYEWDDREDKFANFVKEKNIHWILIPGWFGDRWIEWMIRVANYARINNIPFLGICLWLQVATISFARNACWLLEANSTEFDTSAKDPVIDFLDEQRTITDKWWTMRLWDYEAILKEWTAIFWLYKQIPLTPFLKGGQPQSQEWQHIQGSLAVIERHRHRYEVNPNYHEILQKNWLVFPWMSPDGKLVEFIELKDHKYYVATQAHPEFKSRLQKPHPLFLGLVNACLG